MKGSLVISNFLEVISSLSHSIVFLYFFALIAKEGFLISPWYFLERCIQMSISFLFSFAFHFYSFHIHNWVLFLLWLLPFNLSGVISPLISSGILGTYWPREFIFQCPVFLLFHTVHGISRQEYWSGLPFFSPVDHILSDLSTMTCLSWVAPHGMVSFIELDKAVVHVIRLASFLSLCFQCVCSLMPSLSTYHLPWVYLDLGYLFMAAPAKRSCCLFPRMWGISSQPPLLILDRVTSSRPILYHAAAAPIYYVFFIHSSVDGH